MASIFFALGVLGQLGYRIATVEPLAPVAPSHTITLDLTGIPADAARPAEDWAHGAPDFSRCETPDQSRPRPVLAYLPAADPAARAELAAQCDRIDRVLAQTFRLADWSGRVELSADPAIAELGPRLLPVLAPDAGLEGGPVAAERLGDPAFLAALAFRIELLGDGPPAGLCLDLSTLPDLPAAVAAEAIAALAGAGTRCVIGAPEAGFWQDAGFVDGIDLAVVLGFRAPDGPARPPAPAAWFAEAMQRLDDLIPADKLVVALGTETYIWRSGTFGLTGAGYAQAMAELTTEEASVWFVPWANAARSRYVSADRLLTEAWIADALSLQNQLAELDPGTAVAVWPLGAADPTIWPLLAGGAPDPLLEASFTLDRSVQVTGTGPAVRAATPPRPGRRVVAMDEDGARVIAAEYTAIPAPARLELGGGSQRGLTALSFTALPPAEHWAALEEVLRAADVEASFLVDPINLLDTGEVGRQAIAAGHTVGFRQDRPEAQGALVSGLADNLRQLLMEQRTGQASRLVEAGRLGDWAGISANALHLLENGQVPLLPVAELDPWAPADPALPGPWTEGPAAADRISIAAGPEDWERILRVLPQMLADLAARGHTLGPLGEIAGLPPQAEPAPETRRADPLVGIALAVAAFARDELNTVFFWFLIYAAARSALYLILSLVRRPHDTFDRSWTPPVSVLIPAYNEEKVIEKCIASILAAPYPDLRIVVVDDGSTDDTSGAVAAAFGDDPRVTLIRQANAGKWAAANRAMEEIDSPFFLIADADSIFTPDTIPWLLQQFKDARVGAVAGLVEVGNRESLLGRCQALEYIVSQSIMRRAQEVFNGILVVPGAVGAWRTEAVRRAGLFSNSTVTEDADLTIAVHRAGYRVAFQEQARSVTEAPATARAFMRQRLRWTFGMLQTSWKHRGAIAEGRTVGYVSIIDAIWFGVVSSLFAPVVDLLLLLLLVQGVWALATGGAVVLASLPLALFAAYFALTLLDVANTLVAFRFEGRFDWRLLVLVPLLRFGYRQLLYISTLRAIGQALTGTVAGWNKLDRTGETLSLWSPSAVAGPARAAVLNS